MDLGGRWAKDSDESGEEEIECAEESNSNNAPSVDGSSADRPPPPSYRGAFIAMVHLFEASAVQQLLPERSREGAFPTEIYEMILKSIDRDTRKMCMKVSRKFRHCCLQNLNMIGGIAISGLGKNDLKVKDFNEYRALREDKQGIYAAYKRVAAPGEETARDISRLFKVRRQDTDEEVKCIPNNGSKNRTEESSMSWAIICGENARLSLVTGVRFLNLSLPLPDLPPIAVKDKAQPSQPNGKPDANDQSLWAMVEKLCYDFRMIDPNSPNSLYAVL